MGWQIEWHRRPDRPFADADDGCPKSGMVQREVGQSRVCPLLFETEDEAQAEAYRLTEISNSYVYQAVSPDAA